MDEIVCANTAFRYWRCPPQVRNLYPHLPNSEDGWRALSQAPFVTDVLKTPIIAVASPGCCNHHSGLRSTIRWEGASDAGTTIDTNLGFSVTNPLNTLFTMTRFVSQIDLVLAMYELCGWFSVFEPAPAAEMQLKMAVEENRNSSTQNLFELGEGEDEVPWKRVYARTTVKVPANEGQTNNREDGREVTKLKGTSLWMRKPLIELSDLQDDDFIGLAPQQGGGSNTSHEPTEDLSLEDYFQHFVLEHQDHMTETELARKLGVSRKCLWERRQRLGIPRRKTGVASES